MPPEVCGLRQEAQHMGTSAGSTAERETSSSLVLPRGEHLNPTAVGGGRTAATPGRQTAHMEAPPAPRVARPVMYHQWDHITFLHWSYPSSVVQRLLPPGLTVETADDQAWVGLTPFLMQGVRAPGIPAVPWLSRFPETNLRTYV